MDNKEVAAVLNDLVRICKDGVEGYSLAAKEATSTGLKALLSSYVEQRSRFADELQSEVERLGWKPETDGSVAGNLHRTWMAVKSVVTNRDDAAILAECETGEQVAVETYEMALRHKDLPPRSLSAIERQYNLIVSGRNSMNVLHDQTNLLQFFIRFFITDAT